MDVLIFKQNGQYFGLPGGEVAEVLGSLPVTRLPYALDFVDGLVNTSGQVVTQIDFGVRLGISGRLPLDQGVLLLVNRGGVRFAVHVEKVLAKIDVEEKIISLCSSGLRDKQATDNASSDGQIDECCADAIESERLVRVLKGTFVWDENTVLLLNPTFVQVEAVASFETSEEEGGVLGRNIDQDKKTNSQKDEFSCMVVTTGKESYALRLEDIGEVARVADFTHIPHSPPEVIGVAMLRSMPFLVLSLSELLGGKDHHDFDSKGSSSDMMVVIERGGVCMGLLVEEVLGIERFASEDKRSVIKGEGEIEAYLFGEGGCMMGLINLDGLITNERFSVYENFLVKSQVGDGDKSGKDEISSLLRVLTFSIGSEFCALPLDVVESIEECRHKTDVPGDARDSLSGTIQVRGEVLPVVDLRQKLGFLDDDINTSCIIARANDEVWALMVGRVDQVLSIDKSDIEPIKTSKIEYVDSVGKIDGKMLSILSLSPLSEIAAATD